MITTATKKAPLGGLVLCATMRHCAQDNAHKVYVCGSKQQCVAVMAGGKDRA